MTIKFALKELKRNNNERLAVINLHGLFYGGLSRMVRVEFINALD